MDQSSDRNSMARAQENRIRDDVERDIVRRLHAADESALALILQAYGPLLQYWLRTHFGAQLNEADIEDILSETLFHAWVQRDKYDPARARLSTWLGVLARHAAVDLLRHRAHAAPRSVPLDDPRAAQAAAPQAQPPSPLARDIAQAMNEALTELERDVLRARAAAPNPLRWTDELASRSGRDPGNLRTLHSRAVAKLAARLQQMGYTIVPSTQESPS
jgi:RNA polymerase sigma-70 factor (ECF subfamily)